MVKKYGSSCEAPNQDKMDALAEDLQDNILE
jgi:hypothetical protein